MRSSSRACPASISRQLAGQLAERQRGGHTLELSDAERDALGRFLRSTIDADRYPLSPRLAPLKAILAKLDLKPQAQPLPPAQDWNAEPGDGPEAALDVA